MAEIPNPELSPQAVIQLVLAALKHNDSPYLDAGIETLYSFSSERMRSKVGDMSAYKRALHNDLYKPLLKHAQSEADVFMQIAESARQTVVVDGVPYLFALAKQSYGEYKDCWLLAGLTREGYA
jgi:hypothetical protein